MPPHDRHMAQAWHNGDLLAFIKAQNRQTAFSDWYVTIVFYTALHLFEAILPIVKPKIYGGSAGAVIEHSSGHRARNRLMMAAFSRMYRPYAALYRMSRSARYNCHTPESYKWADAEAYLDEVKKEYESYI